MIKVNHRNLSPFEGKKNKPHLKRGDKTPFCQLTGVCHLSEANKEQNRHLKFT